MSLPPTNTPTRTATSTPTLTATSTATPTATATATALGPAAPGIPTLSGRGAMLLALLLAGIAAVTLARWRR